MFTNPPPLGVDLPISRSSVVQPSSFFAYYTSPRPVPFPSFETPQTVLINRIIDFFVNSFDVDPTDVIAEFPKLCTYFRFDEELLLATMVLLTRYLSQKQWNRYNLDWNKLSYLLVLCSFLVLKVYCDCAISSRSMATDLHIETNQLFRNEFDILSTLQFSFFFSAKDIAPLASVFPLEGFLQLAFSKHILDISPTKYLDVKPFPFHGASISVKQGNTQLPLVLIPANPQIDHRTTPSQTKQIQTTVITPQPVQHARHYKHRISHKPRHRPQQKGVLSGFSYAPTQQQQPSASFQYTNANP
ncbi:hypothetical protein BLNAU_5890 [Blattamonas nauphoetae]|uniref:Cyclin N-terminal domain-containing protein n=1 Tax=Blattamonas nauphoetae TaxID=2049346 RepID=A0ABQ9Y5S2_9EUKA|nr:hypothetical protein BLNAU_5890 [Blattamonas nauphoetae]